MLLRKYANSDGRLLGNIPSEVTNSVSCRCPSFYLLDALLTGRRRYLESTRWHFVPHTYGGYDGFKTYIVVPPDLGLDMFLFWTRDEEPYGQRLAADDSVMVPLFCKSDCVDRRALFIGGHSSECSSCTTGPRLHSSNSVVMI